MDQESSRGIGELIRDSGIALRRLQALTGIEKNRLWRIRKGSHPTIDELHRILVAIDGRFELHRLLMIWRQATMLTEEQIADSVERFLDHMKGPGELPRLQSALIPQVINDRGRGRLLITARNGRTRGTQATAETCEA